MELLKERIRKDGKIKAGNVLKLSLIHILGINYMEHAEESARFKKQEFSGERPFAVYFSKRVNEAVPDGGFIPAYEGLVDSLDYEAELAVIEMCIRDRFRGLRALL